MEPFPLNTTTCEFTHFPFLFLLYICITDTALKKTSDDKKIRRQQLVDLCTRYNLTRSGNMSTLRMSLQNFSGNRVLWERYVVFSFSLSSFDLSSLKGNARRAHLGPTGKRKTAGPRQKTLQRREALVESSASHSDALSLAPAFSDLAPAQRWNQAQHMADLQRVSLPAYHLFCLLMDRFTGTLYCEEISLPDEGNEGKYCGRKGKRDVCPSSGTYR
jgi:hypothetical protein